MTSGTGASWPSGLVCQASFARGSGLGNRLFPWARCTIFADRTGIPMLAPRWVQPRLGPLFRGGLSLQAYHRQILLLGLFKPDERQLRGLRRLLAEACLPRLPEPLDFRSLPEVVPRVGLITFRGDGDHFLSLGADRDGLRAGLERIARPRWLRLVESCGAVDLAVNVRCARDFPPPPASYVSYVPTGPVQTPLDWFRRGMELVRQAAGREIRTWVVSDGTEEQLRPLLELEGVRFLRPGCAISDLLLLSRAHVLLASGGSSFSAWAAFLGGMPVATLPGQSLSWFRLGGDGRQCVVELDPQHPDERFLEAVGKQLRP